MAVSHVRAIVVKLSAPLFFCFFFVPFSAAQGNESIISRSPKALKPLVRPQEGKDEGAPATRSYQSKRLMKTVRGIQIRPLNSVDVSAGGLLSASNGGFESNLWGGSRFSFIEKLLLSNNVSTKSYVMRQLLRRVLVTGGLAPSGSKGSAFMIARLKALKAMGDANSVLQLLSVIPAENREVIFRKYETEMHLIMGKSERACLIVRDEAVRLKDPFWQKARIYCQIVAGEYSQAELGISLLQEEENKSSGFLKLAEGIINGEPRLPNVLKGFGHLELAMITMADLKLPLPMARKYPAALLSKTAVSAPEQLEAIEIAAEHGLLDGEYLNKVYASALPVGSISVEKVDIANTPLNRAQLYMEAKRTKIPVAKAEALERLMMPALKQSRLGGVSRIFAPIIASLAPESDVLWIAPFAFRMSILSGELERATSWLNLAQKNASFSPDASGVFKSLEHFVPIMDLSVSSQINDKSIENMSINQKILYLSLISALGAEVPSETLEALAYKNKKPQIFPDPALWLKLTNLNKMQDPSRKVRIPPKGNDNFETVKELDEKTQGETILTQTPDAKDEVVLAERLGERILLMVAIMEGHELADMNPLVISEIIYGLIKVGLKKEARDLALEVAISAGL